MLRYSIVSKQTRLLSVSRQRAATQFPTAYLANSPIIRGQRRFADSKTPAPNSPTPVSPTSQSSIPPETVAATAPSPTGQGQTSPPSSIQPPQPPTDDTSKVSVKQPRPPKTGRFRRFLLYLILTSGLAYGGGVLLALKSDNFHDFFTEYVPFGEESVLYFEERDFYRRFPNATRHSNRLPPAHKVESQKVTIPSGSGLSWKVAEEDGSGSDLTQKGPHNSAVAKSNESKLVTKAKEERREKKAEVAKKETPKEAPKEEPRKPAVSPAATLELIKLEAADEPVVQELVKVFNDVITVISADGAANKYSAPIAKVRSELESIGEKITALRTEAKKGAEEEVAKAHALFDESAKKLMQQIEEARAAEVAQFREEFETEREKLSHAYQDKVKTELAKAQELAEQRLKNELVEQAIELNRKYLNDVKELVEREREGRLSKISELTTNVNELEKLTSEWSDVIESNLKTQQLQVAIDSVRTVLENASVAKPFVRELVAVKELAADDPVVAAAIASINPTAYQRGIPTASQIIDRFRRVASEVRKASHLSEDAGIARHAVSVALSKVKFSNDGLTDGDDVESVLNRAENMLEEGRLDAAAREVNSLQGWAKILSKDWLADVRRILEVNQALEVMETEARLQCLRVES
ncbi:mitochondrial inner membrane protein Mitofilin [Talaromyces proteolyticus]|uniref:MICOS complex subunit MIC60 n=1 Tax=Talaromyces proteolyticus TaxID=1131652 RepID=A0AAD4KR33_9EURO|nr:mitochondrial inner membrane protein Mitofilin [Talaromyces proteolyticus]KAH8693722.1 mitochondrial inner membrane protein Mitofilin [Talaromyces proteolyticus]